MTIAISSSESLGGRRVVSRTTPRATRARTDAELVARFKQGEIGVFAQIIDRHHERIYNAVWGLLRNHADAEEITQDAFVRAYRGLPLFRGDSSLATWLHRIGTNLARNYYWHTVSRGRDSNVPLDVAPLPGGEATYADLLPGTALDPVREAELNEMGPLIDRCLRRLGATDEDILTRRNRLHQSYGTIARALGIELGTVKSRIARAREKLRKQIVLECPELGAASSPSDWFEPPRAPPRVHWLGAA